MSEELEAATKDQLALAIARGKSVRSWARASNVPRATAHRWSNDPQVRKMAQEIRRRAIDRAVGQMTMRTTWVVKKITKLATDSDSEALRLRALRGLNAEMISLSKYSGLEARLVEVEEMLDAQHGHADRAE
jgi:hypothetical protein